MINISILAVFISSSKSLCGNVRIHLLLLCKSGSIKRCSDISTFKRINYCVH